MTHVCQKCLHDIIPIDFEDIRGKAKVCPRCSSKYIGEKMTDNMKKQVGGDHYLKMEIQPLTFIMANNIPYCEGNVIKYVSRYKSKGGVEDLRKAQHYLNMLIQKCEGEDSHE